MAKITFELPDPMKEFIDKEVTAGRHESASAFLQALIARAQWRAGVEDKLEEALDDYEKGNYTTWTKGDFQKLGEELLRKRAKVHEG